MKTRKSEINPAYEISEKKFVLTLARKNKGKHQQHAFFILEEIIDGKPIIHFMDLVGPGLAVFLPNITNAKIRIESFSADTEEELNKKPLLYRCEKKMMDLKPYDEIVLLNPWYIEKEDADRLLTMIREDKKNPPVFNILGESSELTHSSAKSSSKDRGHNCFTYAKEKIEQLNVPDITIPCDEKIYYIDKIASITSLILKGPKKSIRLSDYLNTKTVLFGASVIGAGLLIETARRYYYT